MAQQIKLRRGPVGNLGAVATVQGELLLATGSISDLSGPFITMTGTAGTGTSTVVGKIYEGTTAPTVTSPLTGTPFYATGNNTLYRLNHAGNEALDLSGNLENTIISSIIASGSFSGSFEGDGSGLTGLVNDLDFAGDSGTGTVSLISQTLTIAGGGGIDTSAGSQTLTVSVDSGSLLPYYSGSIFSTVSGDILINSAGVASLQANSVALGTDTTGNYVETVSAGSGIFVAGADAEGATKTVSVDSGSILPYLSGSIFSTVSGDILIDNAGVATIQADSVALGTDTTGDFVGTITAGTGISSTGATTGEDTDHTLSIDYGSSAGTAVEGDTTITINGTSNEIEITGTAAQALGGGPSYTIGLPDDVTIAGTLTASTGSITGNLTVGGNLFVEGTTTTIDSTTVQIGDNIIELNTAGGVNGGLLIKDVTAPSQVSGSLLWDATNDYWIGGPLGSEKEIALLSTDPTTNKLQKINASGHLVDSTISDDGSDVTMTGELIVQGLTADSFVVTNGSSQLLEVTPSTAGDIVQWNGSAFVASNVIDGGTF